MFLLHSEYLKSLLIDMMIIEMVIVELERRDNYLAAIMAERMLERYIRYYELMEGTDYRYN